MKNRVIVPIISSCKPRTRSPFHAVFGETCNRIVTSPRHRVRRRGIYSTFKSKQGLFLAALEHYLTMVVGPLLSERERPDAGLAAIQTYFARQRALRGHRRGCAAA